MPYAKRRSSVAKLRGRKKDETHSRPRGHRRLLRATPNQRRAAEDGPARASESQPDRHARQTADAARSPFAHSVARADRNAGHVPMPDNYGDAGRAGHARGCARARDPHAIADSRTGGAGHNGRGEHARSRSRWRGRPVRGEEVAFRHPSVRHKQPETTELSVDALQGTDYNPAPPERRVGRVAFNHTTHARDNYSIDGKKVIGCVECHHTDQPAAGLPAGGVLKTGLRNAVLTKETFSASGPPVLSCRACHAQQDKKPPVCADPQQAARYAFCPNNPQASYSEEGDVEINNTQAYHRNCKDCHEKAVAEHRKPGALPFIKAAPPTACAGCHKPRT